MIDTTVTVSGNTLRLPLFILILSIAIIIGTIATEEPYAAFPSLPLLGLALGLWLGRTRAETIFVGADGLDFPSRDLQIPYAELQGVSADKAGGRFTAIYLYCRDAAIRLPATMNVEARDFHTFLLRQLPAEEHRDSTAVPRVLADYVGEQLAKFGPEKVFVYLPQPHPRPTNVRRLVGSGLGLLLGGTLLLAVSQLVPPRRAQADGMMAAGIVAMVVGVLTSLTGMSQRKSARPPNWKKSCLVVTPLGIALSQGEMQGQMRWEEIRAIEHPPARRVGTHRAGAGRNGIGLLVAGAYIIINDYYDRPPTHIRKRMRDYWDG